jgi:hypothetical protein
MWPNRLPRLEGFSYVGFQRYLVTNNARCHAAPFADPSVAGELRRRFRHALQRTTSMFSPTA